MPPTMWGTVAPAAAPAKATKSPLGGLAAVAGGVLAIAGVFSGWVTLDPGGNSETVTAWSLTAGEGLLKSNDPYALVALGAAAVVLGLLLFAGVARTLVRVAVIFVGLGIVAVAAVNWSSIASFITDTQSSSFQADTAIGFYFAIAGGALAAIAGLLPAKKK